MSGERLGNDLASVCTSRPQEESHNVHVQECLPGLF